MSRMYDNKPLANLALNNISVSHEWNEDKFTSGDGALIEGTIKGRCRVAISDSKSNKVKYFILFVDPQKSHRRKFDSNGQEVEPNVSETLVRTGYLNTSYKTEPKGKSDKLSDQEVRSLINKSEVLDLTSKHVPSGCGDCLQLWLPEDQTEKLELETGDSVRIKTKGNSPFICNIAKIETVSATVSNYAGGEQVGASWTDKIMNMKSSGPAEEEEEDDDQDWD